VDYGLIPDGLNIGLQWPMYLDEMPRLWRGNFMNSFLAVNDVINNNLSLYMTTFYNEDEFFI